MLAAIPERSRGIFLALALLGLRPSEAARLRAADYAPGDPGSLTIRLTKNRDVKRLPVPDELADWIAKHVAREARLSGSPLFTLPYCGHGRRPAGPWTKTSLRRVWKAACAATGVEISLYEGTKHSRATDLLGQGVSERVLQAAARPPRCALESNPRPLVDFAGLFGCFGGCEEAAAALVAPAPQPASVA